MASLIDVFMCILCGCNLIFTILHIYGRVKLCTSAMIYSTDTPRNRSKSVTDWFTKQNLTNDYYSKYDHFIAISSSLMFLINLSISILILLYETSLFPKISNSIHSNERNCQIFVRAIGLLFLISKSAQYSFLSMLIFNATRDSMFEKQAKMSLRLLWILLAIASVYLICIAWQFNSSQITEDSYCIFNPSHILWISFILIDIGISIFILYLLIKPLYIAAREVHERITSLREDPLHQLMWKYITLINPMAISTFLVIVFNLFDNFQLSFSYFLVLLLLITNCLCSSIQSDIFISVANNMQCVPIFCSGKRTD